MTDKEVAISTNIQACVTAFKEGKPVLVFDSAFREKETDLLFPASNADPAAIRRLRQDCGGLLFLAIGDEIGDLFGLPFLQDLHTTQSSIEFAPVLNHLKTNDLKYDSRSAFTLTLNHRKTYTGITDTDRSLTTKRFSSLFKELVEKKTTREEAQTALGKEFRTPGHIPLCREAKGGLNVRQGHTELAVSIARLAGLEPCVIGAEMLEPNGDKALKVEDAKAYGEKHNIPFVTGKEVLKAYKALDSQQVK